MYYWWEATTIIYCEFIYVLNTNFHEGAFVVVIMIVW
jgi:hypothetical protein